MVYVPEGSCPMGSKEKGTYLDEHPVHYVHISPFLLDIHEATNRQFSAFVETTEYKTMAERPIDRDDIKKEAPPGIPKSADSILHPGCLVFCPTSGPATTTNGGNRL